jgi:hypothetical protein
MKTFKNIQDDVLDWMADSEDVGLLRDLVKQAINSSHRKLLTGTQWDFMLYPATETVSVSAGRKCYSLHPLFFTPLFFYNPTTDEYLEDIKVSGLMESEEDWQDGEAGEPDRFSLATIAHVQAQPTNAGTVSIATTGGTESSANSVVIRGIVNGDVQEEELSSGSSWSSLTGSLSFSKILDVTKVGASWSRLITVTCDSTTILTLGASEFGKEFRQIELLKSPTASATILYRFFQKPRTLVRDNDIPQIPTEYVDFLVWDTLLKMQGYARSTPEELMLFQTNLEEAQKGLLDTYKLARSLGARPTYLRYIPRI